MQPRTGIVVESVDPRGPAGLAGIRAGDTLLTANGKPLRDAIDFLFYKNEDILDIVRRQGDSISTVRIPGAGIQDLGLTIRTFKVKTCRNNCIFCFVKQLPRGLRKTLYVKDEDYRLSFLYGNYITLSNLDAAERKRIVEQRLSPIYLSVHTTNRALRSKMLGNSKIPDIMKELKYFSDSKIRMHVQIVLCPGYNDGRELQSTIRDLYKFYPYVSSIAVVPVGLTQHRKVPLSPVTAEIAVRAIETVQTFQKRLVKKHGDPLVYCSDEMFITADLPFPPLAAYGSLPQIENGVGMVPLFLSQAKKVKIPRNIPQKTRFVTVTGKSFYPFLKRFIERLSKKEQITIDVLPVENRLFGPSVTVTGLLTGRDIIGAIHDLADRYDVLVVPDTALKEDEDVFLDDVSLKDIKRATDLNPVRSEATPQGLLDTLASLS